MCIYYKKRIIIYIVLYPDFFSINLLQTFFYEQYNLLQYTRTKELDPNFSGLVQTKPPSNLLPRNVYNDDVGMRPAALLRMRGFKSFLAAKDSHWEELQNIWGVHGTPRDLSPPPTTS